MTDDDEEWDESIDEDNTAVREEETMSHAPRQLFEQIASVSAGGLIDELHSNGVARLNNLLRSVSLHRDNVTTTMASPKEA
jgi:hypothetical protein